jgi:hypothetical protein
LNSRRVFQSLVVLAIALSFTSSAFAGGGGGGKSKVNVRVQNFTDFPQDVAVANKNPQNFRTLEGGQIAQFKVSKGNFQVDADGVIAAFNTGKLKTVYVALTENGPEETTTRF